MKATIRTASEDDAAQILGIYTSYVLDSAVSFEVEVEFSRLPRDPAWHGALDAGRQLLRV